MNLLHALSVLLVLISVTVKANDAHIGTEAGNIFIEYVKDIEMVEEKVTHIIHSNHAEVKCEFWLYNSGAPGVRYIGFPDFWENTEYSADSVRDFKTFINGKEIKVGRKRMNIIEFDQKGMPSEWEENKDWFVWETHFDKNDTVHITNTYNASYGGVNVIHDNVITYIYGTGASWYKSIGKGLIEFDFSQLISTLWIDTIEIPSNIKPVITNDKVSFSFENLEPEENDKITIRFITPYEERMSDDIIYMHFEGEKDLNTLRLMRNEIFARSGYKFNSKDLTNYFNKTSWYTVDPDYSDDLLTDAEKQFIRVLKKLETSLE